MEPIQEEDPRSILPVSQCTKMFFAGIAIIAGSTLITVALHYIHIWTNEGIIPFRLWIIGGVGLLPTGLGIVFGLLHASSWPQRLWLFLMYAVVTGVVVSVCADYYINTLGYPQSSVFLNLIADLFR